MQESTKTYPTSAPGREEGQAMVEFALVLPILCLVLFALVEFGMAFWTYQQVSAAASEGARRASISRTSSDRVQRTVDAARTASPQLNASDMTVDVASTWAPGDQVAVTVSYPEQIRVMGVTLFSQNLRVQRAARVEQ